MPQSIRLDRRIRIYWAADDCLFDQTYWAGLSERRLDVREPVFGFYTISERSYFIRFDEDLLANRGNEVGFRCVTEHNAEYVLRGISEVAEPRFRYLQITLIG